MRIVVIEDNQALLKGLKYYLEDAGHAVDALTDGIEAETFLRDDGGDIVVLDINLPGRDGLSLLRDMRTRGDQRPVLMLTARANTNDRVEGLDAGADDYLIKPFEMAEFGARIRALARRAPDQASAHRTIGALRFDVSSRTLTGPDGPLNLPRREVALFERLLLADGRLVSKQVLLDSLYGTGADVDEPVVEVYVSRLRKRLLPFGVKINVTRGMGYRMQADA